MGCTILRLCRCSPSAHATDQDVDLHSDDKHPRRCTFWLYPPAGAADSSMRQVAASWKPSFAHDDSPVKPLQAPWNQCLISNHCLFPSSRIQKTELSVPRFSCTTISPAFLCYSLTTSLCSWPCSFIIFSETCALGFLARAPQKCYFRLTSPLGGFHILFHFGQGCCYSAAVLARDHLVHFLPINSNYTNTSNHAVISPVPASTRTGHQYYCVNCRSISKSFE